jgi:hypothetical protein
MPDEASRIRAVLSVPGSTLLPLSVIAQRADMTEIQVRQVIEAHPTEFRVTTRPFFGEHLYANMDSEPQHQRAARLWKQRRGRLFSYADRAAITDDLARRLLEAQGLLD